MQHSLFVLSVVFHIVSSQEPVLESSADDHVVHVDESTESPSTTISAAPRPCKSKWYHRPQQNACYKMERRTCSYELARYTCRKMGGDMVSIRNPEEMALVNAMAEGKPIWIGARKGRDGVWHWADDTPFNYTNWRKGQPDGTTPDVKCVLVNLECANQKWDDVKCDDSRRKGFVCKAKPNPEGYPDPSPNANQED